MGVSKKSFIVAGLEVGVYSHSTAIDPSVPVVAFFLLHGRTGSTKEVIRVIEGVFKSTYNANVKETQRDLIFIAFDQRNHGTRLVSQQANLAWDDNPDNNNDTHAIDMYCIQTGTARDVSFLIDFLPSYLYPYGERTISQWGMAGISLGGHATWIAMVNDPRISVGIPIIGCPDYFALISPRAEKSSVPLVPPYMPQSLASFLRKYDPVSTPYRENSSSNPFLGRKILVLSGGKDLTVPWSATRPFVEKLEVGTGVKKIVLEEEAGHECTPKMVAEMAQFILDECLTK